MIEVEGLRKDFVVRRGRFRRERHVVHAVNDISFRVDRGELLGYLGPNGAGKSTTIKMLTGILVPTAGHVSVAGLEPSRKRIELARRIGAMFGQRIQLWWDLPLHDSFELLRHIYRVPAERHRANLARFREVLELDPFLDTPVRQLSLGQRIRGELTAAMLHGPELLFLDEPTIGLDVVAKQRVRDFLVEINREDGVTVMLTTHDLGDIERLCNRLLVIDHGSLIWDGGIAGAEGALRRRTHAGDRSRGAGAAHRGRRRSRRPCRRPAAVAALPWVGVGADGPGRRGHAVDRPPSDGARHRRDRQTDLREPRSGVRHQGV